MKHAGRWHHGTVGGMWPTLCTFGRWPKLCDGYGHSFAETWLADTETGPPPKKTPAASHC